MVGPENVLRRPTQHEEPLADFEVAVHGSAQHGCHAVVARARLASVRGTAVHEHPLGHLMGSAEMMRRKYKNKTTAMPTTKVYEL